MKHLLCFGFGYTSRHLIPLLPGWQITGTSRSFFECQDVKCEIFDSMLKIPENVTHILVSIPPIDQVDIVHSKFAPQIRKLKHLEWICYISSTGVYGDHLGKWVTEDSPTYGTSKTRAQRLQAETLWLKEGAYVMRSAGIYGPKRSAIDKLLAGTAVPIIDKDVYFSRIHVHDLSTAIKSSIDVNRPCILNVSDDMPCNPSEVTRYAYSLLHLDAPNPVSIESAGLSDFGMSFYTSSKKVSNARLKKELSWSPIYPTYRDGLRSILSATEAIFAQSVTTLLLILFLCLDSQLASV